MPDDPLFIPPVPANTVLVLRRCDNGGWTVGTIPGAHGGQVVAAFSSADDMLAALAGAIAAEAAQDLPRFVRAGQEMHVAAMPAIRTAIDGVLRQGGVI